MGEECEKWQRYIGKNVSLAAWPLAGPMVPAIVERDEKFLERPNRSASGSKTMQRLWKRFHL